MIAVGAIAATGAALTSCDDVRAECPPGWEHEDEEFVTECVAPPAVSAEARRELGSGFYGIAHLWCSVVEDEDTARSSREVLADEDVFQVVDDETDTIVARPRIVDGRWSVQLQPGRYRLQHEESAVGIFTRNRFTKNEPVRLQASAGVVYLELALGVGGGTCRDGD